MKLNKVINLQNKEAVLLMNWESLLKQFATISAGIILKMAKVVEYILNRDQTEAW